MSWSVIGIVDIKLISMSVSIEDSCYCAFKPENKLACFRKCLNTVKPVKQNAFSQNLVLSHEEKIICSKPIEWNYMHM
jgi:hypothetical protein